MRKHARINDRALGRLAGIGFWLVLIAVLLDPPAFVDLQNAPVLLLLVSAVYSLFLPLFWSLLLSAIAVLVLNYEMVPPVKTFNVDIRAHGILLITITLVSWILSYLLRQQREIALKEQQQNTRTLELMNWSEQLRAAEDPQSLLPNLHELLQTNVQHKRVVLGFQEVSFPHGMLLNSLQSEGYYACLNDNLPFGPGTGRHENQSDLYLPFRGKSRAFGACVITPEDARHIKPQELAHVQALCDQMGLACERKDHALQADKAKERITLEETRNVFLSAIAHDQRTPLASIITSATAMIQQTGQLSTDQLKGHAELIVSEANQMNRLIDNTLYLARLSGQGVTVQLEPESAEDVLSAVFQRLRARGSKYIPQVKVAEDLPLFNCNITLLEQALDNLIDNAIKYSGTPTSIEVKAYQDNFNLVFEVRDHGQGMGAQLDTPSDGSRGMGIGLKLCSAVAQVHQGALSIENVPGSGTVAKLSLPGLSK